MITILNPGPACRGLGLIQNRLHMQARRTQSISACFPHPLAPSHRTNVDINPHPGMARTRVPSLFVACSYTDSNWRDKLTAYDGQTITYDAIVQRIANGIIGNGLPIIRRQLVLPVVIRVRVNNGVDGGAGRAGGADIVRLGEDVAAAVIAIQPRGAGRARRGIMGAFTRISCPSAS